MRFDAATGVHGIPNSVCWEKEPESPTVEYRFNSCGHRAGMECGPKRADTYRIVMVGSSVPLGQYVPQDASFAALLPKQLMKQSPRRVELYNASMGFGFSHSTALRFKEALAAQPDLILWIVTPTDISRGAEVAPSGNSDPGASLTFFKREWHRMRAALAEGSVQEAWSKLFGYTTTNLMLRHFLYLSQSETLRLSLEGSDIDEGYLKAQPSEAWRGFLSQFEKDAADVEGQATSAGVAFAAALVPGRVQAAMISTDTWPDGWNPYKLGDAVRSIVTRNGGVYIDILPDFRLIPNPELDYFAVDGHPNEEGHRLLAMLLARKLTNGSIPALQRSNEPETVSAKRP